MLRCVTLSKVYVFISRYPSGPQLTRRWNCFSRPARTILLPPTVARTPKLYVCTTCAAWRQRRTYKKQQQQQQDTSQISGRCFSSESFEHNSRNERLPRSYCVITFDVSKQSLPVEEVLGAANVDGNIGPTKFVNRKASPVLCSHLGSSIS